jgi:hypothetical protein
MLLSVWLNFRNVTYPTFIQYKWVINKDHHNKVRENSRIIKVFTVKIAIFRHLQNRLTLR